MTGGAILSFSLAIWPASALQREIERLDSLIARANATTDTEPQEVLEEYRPRLFAEYAFHLLDTIWEGGYGRLGYYQPWVQEKSVGEILNIVSVRIPPNLDKKTPKLIGETLEEEKLAQVMMPGDLIQCNEKKGRRPLLITNMLSPRIRKSSTELKFLLGRRVARAGEPPKPAGSLVCRWETSPSRIPVLDPGSFSDFFPLLAGPYQSRPLTEIRDFQKDLRDEVLSRPFELGVA